MKSKEEHPKGTVKTALNGLLSDHAYQSSSFSVLDSKNKPSFTISAGSYNTQDFCISKETNSKINKHDYANNPFNCDETKEQFYERKLIQMDKILEKIKNGDDIVFLQEVDFLTDKKYADLKEIFEKKLDKAGYKIELTKNSNDPTILQQKMATIYNANKFKVISSKGAVPTPMGSPPKTYVQNRGFETTFAVKDGVNKGMQFVTTNLHLWYGYDYKDELLKYQSSHKGKLHIMGGDTNNIQNEKLKTALGDWNIATNISAEDPKNYKGLTLIHKKDVIDGKEKTFKKAYDRFFVTAPNDGHVFIKPNENRSEQITLSKEGTPKEMLISKSDAKSSMAVKGQPWQRTKDMLADLDISYKNAKSSEKLDILKKIHQVVVVKNYKDKLDPLQLKNAYDDYVKLYPSLKDLKSDEKEQKPLLISKVNQMKQSYHEIKNPPQEYKQILNKSDLFVKHLPLIVESYKKEIKKDPISDPVNGIALSFSNQQEAIRFFGQESSSKAFDMYCKTTDHRVYSDGKGVYLQGTMKEVDAYLKNPENYVLEKDGVVKEKLEPKELKF